MPERQNCSYWYKKGIHTLSASYPTAVQYGPERKRAIRLNHLSSSFRTVQRSWKERPSYSPAASSKSCEASRMRDLKPKETKASVFPSEYNFSVGTTAIYSPSLSEAIFLENMTKKATKGCAIFNYLYSRQKTLWGYFSGQCGGIWLKYFNWHCAYLVRKSP